MDQLILDLEQIQFSMNKIEQKKNPITKMRLSCDRIHL